MATVSQLSTAASSDDRLTRELVRDLHQPRPGIFWTDLLATAIVGWSAFWLTASLRPYSWAMLGAAAVSVFALYRGLCFVHEISHLNARALKGFEPVWNILFGFPLLMPSFVYAGVHQYHHKLSTYGTREDPEYMPFSSSAFMTMVFAAQSLLVPVFLMVRFLLLTPFAFAFAPVERWVNVHASSLTMNIAFRRDVDTALLRKIRRQSGIVWLCGAALAALTLAGRVPLRFWLTWLGVSAFASFINTLRTLGAHAYESTGEPMSRDQQLRDSIDTPGAFWTELWAPVGLRYHALHHYFPGVPYHNLGAAYRRLTAQLDPASDYRKVSSKSLPHSLTALLERGFSRQR